MDKIAATADISRFIWEQKYRYKKDGVPVDRDITDTWTRVARAIASVEQTDQEVWEQLFYNALEGYRFLPGGRILAGAGTDYDVTLYNCFVMGRIDDSLDGIFTALKEGALTMQQGGGVGYDFSTIRPRGALAKRSGNIASGPVSFMHTWNSMCATITSAGNRRGAMMACLRCDHPDIEEFVDAKRKAGALERFNLSVLVTDAFMQAVQDNQTWSLVFQDNPYGKYIEPRIYKQLPARELWDRILQAAYDTAEPGVLFIDQINRQNNLAWCEQIHATNPCGEIPLPYYGACNLGSVNLTQLVHHPFTSQARFDFEELKVIVNTAVRMLDNVIDLSRFPVPAQKQVAQETRRIGLGITGLADIFMMMGYRYGDKQSVEFADEIMKTLCHTAYRTSIDLAKEKGSFPILDKSAYLATPFAKRLPEDIRQGIADHGIRNSHLVAIAPAGTISLLAGNVSSGLEPVFDYCYQRQLIASNDMPQPINLEDYAYHIWQRGHDKNDLPGYFVTAREISPQTILRYSQYCNPMLIMPFPKQSTCRKILLLMSSNLFMRAPIKKDLKDVPLFAPMPFVEKSSYLAAVA